MKKVILTLVLLISPLSVSAANLLEVYKQAQISDPTFQQAISQRLSTKEGVPISLSSLLPNLSANFNPTIQRQSVSGSSLQTDIAGNSIYPRNNTQRAYLLSLSLKQTVFDYAQFANLQGACATSKAADATLNSALQDLMVRTAKAYFTILENEDKLRYTEATKLAYKEQLDQAKQQYDVGLKTITDVYTAQARYESAVADVIAKETDVANARENLRVITGKYYPDLAKLSERLPLVSPSPSNIESWVHTAMQQNWAIKTAQYTTEGKLQNVHQQFAGHLPTAQLQGSVSRQYADNVSSQPSINNRNGPGTINNKTIGLNVNFPIFSGGGVMANTSQATYELQVSQQQMEQTFRDTINQTRQSYMNVMSGISQIKADRQAIKSNISSLEGMEESYKVGTETLVNVLNQQQKLFESQTEYATDRYAYVNHLLLLKQAAGTLSFDDLYALNRWLSDDETDSSIYKRKNITHYKHIKATTKAMKKPKTVVSLHAQKTHKKVIKTASVKKHKTNKIT